jgi:hypothetical protein
MGRRILNVAFLIGGILLVVFSSRLLLRHEYAFLYHQGLLDSPKRWVPTIVPFLIGIWVFYCGLVGFVDERRKRSRKFP